MLPLLKFSDQALGAVQRRLRTAWIRMTTRRRGLPEACKIPTFTVREELETLFELARGCPANARVLEIGSYLGASTCFIAAGLSSKGAKIICVDTWQNQTMPDGIRDTYAIFQKNLQAVRHQITTIRKFSGDITTQDLGAHFDLVFLDGDHSYRQTRADFNLIEARVTEKGIIAFHDSQFFEGVSRVIGEALASGKWQVGGSVRNLFWIKRAEFAHRD